MRNIFLILLIILFSCKTSKIADNSIDDISENKLSLDTNVVSRDIDTTDIQSNDSIEKQFSPMMIDDRKEENYRFREAIKQHEVKTSVKVIDRSSKRKSNVVDTTTGWIAYSVPDHMQVSKNYSVKVRISKKTSGQNKAVLILGQNDAINNPNYKSIATIEDVKVSGEMSAELRGDSESFNIVGLSTQVQNIDNESYTEWEWVVTPKKRGDSPLKLIIKLKDLNKDIVVFNKNVNIKTNVPVVVEGFFEKYWQWFMTTILIPIFLYYWNRKKKQKKS